MRRSCWNAMKTPIKVTTSPTMPNVMVCAVSAFGDGPAGSRSAMAVGNAGCVAVVAVVAMVAMVVLNRVGFELWTLT